MTLINLNILQQFYRFDDLRLIAVFMSKLVAE